MKNILNKDVRLFDEAQYRQERGNFCVKEIERTLLDIEGEFEK